MNILKKIVAVQALLLFTVVNVFSQSQWDVQIVQSNLNCSTNEVCYRLQVKSATGTSWTLADQNYRLFFDGDLMTVNSVVSLLPTPTYGSANIDQNIKISGQGQETSSPLDDIDDNLGFLDFSIVLSNKNNPSAAQGLTFSEFVDVAEICVTSEFANIGENCLSFYHSRPSTAGAITNQFTTLSENDAPGSTVFTSGANYNDLNFMDGSDACPNLSCSTSQWDIRLSQTSLNCEAAQVCYQLDVRNTGGVDWALGDQNYRLFYDGDLMTVASVSSLLPPSIYGNADIDQNIKITGQGQETSSPLDDIDDNLGFLDFNIVQQDKTNPSAATQLVSGNYTGVATICVDVVSEVINNPGAENCLSFYHSRPSTAGSITNQYTVITENDAPESTEETEGNVYNDLTQETSELDACPWFSCNTREWDIRLSQTSLNCEAAQVCYQLDVRNTGGVDWALGDQNYRLFYDGDLMTVASVTSLLPPSIYGNADIDQNIKITGQGQETSSPLDDIDNNLGFLDFNIVQQDKTNPSAATQLVSGNYTGVATICVDVVPEVINNPGAENCLSFYHSRPSTAGSITNQYTVITENDAPESTEETEGAIYNDLTQETSELDACPGFSCVTAQWDIQFTRSSVDCDAGQVCYQLELQNTAGANWGLGDQNYRFFYNADLMNVTSVSSLLPTEYYNPAQIDQNFHTSEQGQEASSPLDNIDDNLGFLDFNIVQYNKSHPLSTTQILTNSYTPIATICADVVPEVINNVGEENCLSFYHSRPSTAGSFTNQYTVITENDAPESTAETNGINYNDITMNEEGCLAVTCSNPICDLEVITSPTIYNDNDTPEDLLDDTFTFSITVTGSNLLGWEGGGQTGAYGDTVEYGPYPVGQDGVIFSITDAILGMQCQTSIGVNVQPCVYTGDCTCCKSNE